MVTSDLRAFPNIGEPWIDHTKVARRELKTLDKRLD